MSFEKSHIIPMLLSGDHWRLELAALFCYWELVGH